jgi:hypothetical protein
MLALRTARACVHTQIVAQQFPAATTLQQNTVVFNTPSFSFSASPSSAPSSLLARRRRRRWRAVRRSAADDAAFSQSAAALPLLRALAAAVDNVDVAVGNAGCGSYEGRQVAAAVETAAHTAASTFATETAAATTAATTINNTAAVSPAALRRWAAAALRCVSDAATHARTLAFAMPLLLPPTSSPSSSASSLSSSTVRVCVVGARAECYVHPAHWRATAAATSDATTADAGGVSGGVGGVGGGGGVGFSRVHIHLTGPHCMSLPASSHSLSSSSSSSTSSSLSLPSVSASSPPVVSVSTRRGIFDAAADAAAATAANADATASAANAAAVNVDDNTATAGAPFDLFALFNPGLGALLHRSGWAAAAKAMLETRRPLLLTAMSAADQVGGDDVLKAFAFEFKSKV